MIRLGNFKTRMAIPSVLAACLISPLSVQAAVEPCLNISQLPAPSGSIVDVSTVSGLNSAVSNLQSGQTIRLAPGTYNLTTTLYIGRHDVTIMGSGADCGEVVLAGRGMDNAVDRGNVRSGIWTNAQNLTVMNLTIRDVYEHGIIFNSGAQSPVINSVALINTGTQFIKSNPTSYGNGVDNGVVMNTLMKYEVAPPTTDHSGGGTGYTNGVDVHAGAGWHIHSNRFENFHTPDSADNLWSPAVLMWNGASDTITENNVFINVDRSVAYGLIDRTDGYDHEGGVIRNNMMYYRPGLYSSSRRNGSDGAIIVWNSPNTVVAHNTVLSNGNLNRSIEFRFNTSGAQAINNLLDVTMGTRSGAAYSQSGNVYGAVESWFVDPASGDLRLQSSADAAIDQVDVTPYAETDVDGTRRSGVGQVDAGAHELMSMAPPMPPENIRVE